MTDMPIGNNTELENSQQEAQTTSGIQERVQESIEKYFDNLDGQSTNDIYNMVINEVEQPLLRAVLKHTRGNQTRASEILGINRGTLRKKLEIYGLSKS